MSYAIEVLYPGPRDLSRELRLSAGARRLGGELTCVDDPDDPVSRAVTLTYEFEDRGCALSATVALREMGEFVEGPYDY